MDDILDNVNQPTVEENYQNQDISNENEVEVVRNEFIPEEMREQSLVTSLSNQYEEQLTEVPVNETVNEDHPQNTPNLTEHNKVGDDFLQIIMQK